MGSSPPPPSRLTPLQRDLLDGFFEREQRFFLTGGGALAGFYFGHRETEDIDLFGAPGLDLGDAAHAIEGAAAAAGATLTSMKTFPDFRRLLAARGEEQCIVDLVIDRAPMVEPTKAAFGVVRVDTLREIAANKICTLLSRSEIKDLVDLEALVGAGIDLGRAFADAQKKDGGADPATLAWVLDQISIGPDAALPGGADPARLTAFRDAFTARLRAMAFDEIRRDTGGS
jgi:Nucleotidyl transferase AbiEii toxin, Type IV TA system